MNQCICVWVEIVQELEKALVRLRYWLHSLKRIQSRRASVYKPCTQCVSVQIVTKFCEENNIAHTSWGPVIYKKGYTYEAIDEGSVGRVKRMDSVINSILEIGKGKKLVLVDGVGYASVGSCAGVSNAQFASRLGAPTLLISTFGVGDAIDKTNLNLAYYEVHE
eukprot:UN26597